MPIEARIHNAPHFSLPSIISRVPAAKSPRTAAAISTPPATSIIINRAPIKYPETTNEPPFGLWRLTDGSSFDQLANGPDVAGNAKGHAGGNAQGFMDPTQIVMADIKAHRSLVVFQLL